MDFHQQFVKFVKNWDLPVRPECIGPWGFSRKKDITGPQPDVENGLIAAVIVEEILPEATLKIVRKKRNVLELHSANPAYPIMQFPQRHRRKVRIIGKYIGVVRKIS